MAIMKKFYSLLFLLTLLVLLTNCSQGKSTSSDNPYRLDSIEMTGILKKYPHPQGYQKYVISVPGKPDESQFIVEIIPGKTMQMDECNDYSLQGEFVEDSFADEDVLRYIYRSEGEVVQTLLGCATDSLHTEFARGMPVLVDYNSLRPTVVYLPKDIELKHTVWKVAEMIQVEHDPENKLFEKRPFDLTKDKYDGYILQLPAGSENSKIELVVGITKKVDCNRHRLIDVTFGDAGDMNFSPHMFMIFDSDGEIASTRMGCPDRELTGKFIYGETRRVPYTTDPMIIFIPKGFELRYRIWESVV